MSGVLRSPVQRTWSGALGDCALPVKSIGQTSFNVTDILAVLGKQCNVISVALACSSLRSFSRSRARFGFQDPSHSTGGLGGFGWGGASTSRVETCFCFRTFGQPDQSGLTWIFRGLFLGERPPDWTNLPDAFSSAASGFRCKRKLSCLRWGAGTACARCLPSAPAKSCWDWTPCRSSSGSDPSRPVEWSVLLVFGRYPFWGLALRGNQKANHKTGAHLS